MTQLATPPNAPAESLFGDPSGDPAHESLPQANVVAAGSFPPEQFVEFDNVPVFKEHRTTDRDGRQIHFGAKELQAVVDRCNRRIRDTGDYATVTVGHTPSPEDQAKGKEMPPVVGYAGPFRLGTLGQGGKQKYAILADMHIFKKDIDCIRKNPRRSPEVWLEDKFEDMFLDPIALLGAEPPRLDMGLLYSAQRHGRQILKYTAAAPAAGNTYIPTDDARRSYSSEESNMEGQEIVRQIVDAIEQLDWVQWVKAEMQASQEANTAGAEAGLENPAPAAVEDPAGQPAPAAPAAAPVEPVAGPPADPAPAEPAPAPSPEEEEAKRERLSKCYSAADELNDDEFDEYCTKRKNYAANATGEYQEASSSEGFAGHKTEHEIGTKNYAAGSVEDENAHNPGTASVEPENPGPSSKGSADDESGNATGEYQGQPTKTADVAKFGRLQADVGQLTQTVETLKYQLQQEQAQRVDAQRLSVLQDLRHRGYSIDPEKDLERCKYGKMSEEQFGEHVEFVSERVACAPLNGVLPYSRDGAQAAPDAPGAPAARAKYSKEVRDRAFRVCQEKASRGESVDYESELVTASNGQAV